MRRDERRALSVGLTAITLLVVFCVTACQPKTPSLIHPGEKVTQAQLSQEVATLNGELEKQAAEINRKAAASAAEHNAAVAAHEAERKTLETKVQAAGADLAEQAQLRAEIWAVASGGVQALAQIAIPPAAAWAPIAGAGLLSLTTLGTILYRRRAGKAEDLNVATVGTIQELRKDPTVAAKVPAARDAALPRAGLSRVEFDAGVATVKDANKIPSVTPEK